MYMTQTKISRKWMLAVTALLSVMILMLAAMQTNAAPATTAPAAPTNIAQTSAFGSYAKIKWDAVKGTGVKYQIEVSQDKVKWVPLATVGNTYYTVSKMETGAIYYFRIKTVIGTLSSPYTEPFQVITQPGYISEVKQTASKANQVTVSWTAAAGAGAYDVYIGTTEENVKYNQTVKAKTTATIKKLKKDKTYIVKIVPFNISPSGYRTDGFERANTSIRTLPGKVSGLSLVSWAYGSTNITVEWNEKENADGYQVKIYNAANKCIKTINTTGTKTTFKKAAAATSYKVRIRPYITVNGKKKYGAYNKTPIYPIAQPKLTAFTQATGKLTLAWDPVEGATSYSVYLTTTNPNYPASYVKVATVDKSVVKLELTKLGTADITLLDNYYGYVVAEKKVGNKTYSSKVTQAWYCSNN